MREVHHIAVFHPELLGVQDWCLWGEVIYRKVEFPKADKCQIIVRLKKKKLRSDMQDFDFCQIGTLKKTQTPFPIATLFIL